MNEITSAYTNNFILPIEQFKQRCTSNNNDEYIQEIDDNSCFSRMSTASVTNRRENYLKHLQNTILTKTSLKNIINSPAASFAKNANNIIFNDDLSKFNLNSIKKQLKLEFSLYSIGNTSAHNSDRLINSSTSSKRLLHLSRNESADYDGQTNSFIGDDNDELKDMFDFGLHHYTNSNLNNKRRSTKINRNSLSRKSLLQLSPMHRSSSIFHFKYSFLSTKTPVMSYFEIFCSNFSKHLS
jgi:hypothetical protein